MKGICFANVKMAPLGRHFGDVMRCWLLKVQLHYEGEFLQHILDGLKRGAVVLQA